MVLSNYPEGCDPQVTNLWCSTTATDTLEYLVGTQDDTTTLSDREAVSYKNKTFYHVIQTLFFPFHLLDFSFKFKSVLSKAYEFLEVPELQNSVFDGTSDENH